MPDYSNGKVYTIRFHNTNEIYIGSTTQALCRRFQKHKDDKNSAVYKLIYSKYDGDWSICYIELYENYECKSKEELTRKEGEIIRLFKNDSNYKCINCKIEGRTIKEYYEDNRENNKEKEKERHKVYRENNKEKEKKRCKEYREANRDVIAEKMNKKFTCECGGKYTYNYKARHFKTKLHQDYLLTIA